MIYGFENNKPFFKNYIKKKMAKEKYFSLTIILRCTKHSKIRKAFSVNHFTAKGTEVAFKFRGAQPAHESCCALNSVNCSIMKIIIIKKKMEQLKLQITEDRFCLILR
jgi:hypothetical protein